MNHPSYVITYRPPRGSGGWQVELRQGKRMIDTWNVSTRLEAIAKELKIQFPAAMFGLSVLCVVNAWETPAG